MKRVFLVYGDPGSGKSPLARTLRDEHAFECLSLDTLYVEFVRTKCSTLYFDDLKKFVAPHYQRILQPKEYIRYHYERDLVSEWHEFMLTRILEWSARHDNLVVEGYLLHDCLGDVEAHASQIARVFPVKVSNGMYEIHDTLLTAKEIAALGQNEERAA